MKNDEQTRLQCQLCGCQLINKKGEYAKPTPTGRSCGTKHHYVAERFWGRTKNKHTHRASPIFVKTDLCLQNYNHATGLFCYECHEELLHNPIMLPNDVEKFARLIRKRGCDETGKKKTKDRHKIGERIKLLEKIISRGLDELLK